MRTKTLLILAALTAAGVATSMAQSVYSLNVVGYVNVPLLTSGGAAPVTLVANPLMNANNNISNLFSVNIPNGSIIQRWCPTCNGGDFDPVGYSYDAGSSSWVNSLTSDHNGFILNPGEGIFFINAGGDITNTFVGDVIQGPYTNILVQQNLANVIGSSAPLGGNWSNSIVSLVPANGDTMEFWDRIKNGGDLADNALIYDAGASVWNATITLNQNIDAGIGFFYFDGSGLTPPRVWVRNFSVPQTP